MHSAVVSGAGIARVFVDESLQVSQKAVEVGTRTYSRVDWAFQHTKGEVSTPDIYHCYHMCRDLAQQLRDVGHQAWSVMGFNERDGFKQLHPVVVVNTSRGPQLFDPAFGILTGIPIDQQTHRTADGKYEVESKGEAILLKNLKNGKNFLYFWNPNMESFHTNDHFLVRRNNWGGDEYTMTYCYCPKGEIRANVTLFHTTKQDPDRGAILVMDRSAGTLVSRTFSHDQVLGDDSAYHETLRGACATLAVDHDSLHFKMRFMLAHLKDLRASQQECRAKEIARQQSGAPLW